MNRGDLTNSKWKRLAPLPPPQKPQTGRLAHDHRPIIIGIVWILRTGAPWRDLPPCYSPWQTVASRFYRWRKVGIWQQILDALQQQPMRLARWSGPSITSMQLSFVIISMRRGPRAVTLRWKP